MISQLLKTVSQLIAYFNPATETLFTVGTETHKNCAVRRYIAE